LIVWAICFGLSLFVPKPETCGTALSTQRARLSRIPIAKRLHPTLELIAKSCSALDPALADAAKKATGMARLERARILGAAQSECTSTEWPSPAASIEKACAPRSRDPQGEILKTLDAGTYAFVRALRAKLEAAGAPQAAELVLSDLALSSTMNEY
jgi:hypothetical protein